ncbi:MAG TPA: hypothetical protein VGQ39_25480 [Pyrinomonadaceae bacterium]|nr:hypothetical protein [Pyrinomonadaceae bacterium]
MISPILDRIALALARLIPNKVAHHLMFLVQSEPAIPDRWGYHIRPIHYYEPLPDFRSLKAEQINRRRDPAAIALNWEQQLRLLRLDFTRLSKCRSRTLVRGSNKVQAFIKFLV